ncbi:protein rep [Helicobacter heilmannii]|uniref:protein rep n=1 Tax=Helicobacter heilmannii TaxID=35817 RepID=UPI001F26D82D|nr:protein rep [Helicobacter heilmannii]
MGIIPTKFLKKYKGFAIQEPTLKTRFRATNLEKANRCGACASVLGFDHYTKTQESDQESDLSSDQERYKLARGDFCGCKWCPLCSWLKRKKLVTAFNSVFSQIQRDHRVAYILLTLTAKNCALSDLRGNIKHLSKSWDRLTHTELFKSQILGFMRSIEFTGKKTPQGQGHPHYHSILIVKPSYFKGGNYITQATWCELWQKALRVDYKPIVDIRGIREQDYSEVKITSKPKNILSALLYCLKYVVKPAQLKEMSQEDFLTLDEQTQYTRQYNKGGLFKQYKPIKRDELSPDEWQKLERQYYKWCGVDYEQWI